VHNLIRLNKRYAVGSACIGGGQVRFSKSSFSLSSLRWLY
jgi:hypothetical protein